MAVTAMPCPAAPIYLKNPLRRLLTGRRESVSFIRMRRERTIARRQKLLDRLPVTGEILRGSLLQRTIRNHAKGCAKCAIWRANQSIGIRPSRMRKP